MLLATGDVLVAGYTPFSELYKAATGKWVKTGGLNQPRELHTATALHNGKALIAGGVSYGIGVPQPGHTPREAEVYNPATGSWKNTASLNEPRTYHTATLLTDGKVLVVGGSGSGSAELYDPESQEDQSRGPRAGQQPRRHSL